jgi:c(7)-type cytochrome triheme protein
MRMIIAAILILLSGGVAFAVVGGGDLTMKNEGGDVVFSHDNHVISAGLSCKDCHAAIYTNTRQHVTVTMQEMEQGKSCGVCHDGTKAFNVTENCETCHAQDKAKQGRKQ